jgi:two-component system chemotaxis response regulator CheB
VSKLVVIGASQGGLQALKTVVSGLPKHFGAPVLIVHHIGEGPSYLPQTLTSAGVLPAEFASDNREVEPGHIYVAPPDFHLRLNGQKLELSKGPRENWARPAIDPLFRSAAEFYGPDAIGVILTGQLNDGTIGLYEIKRRGGTAIVQDPGEAEAPSMPRSALENVDVDHSVLLTEMPKLLVHLTSQPGERPVVDQGEKIMIKQETKLDRPVTQTCPECGGAMEHTNWNGLSSFKCHIGHAMTAEVLASVQLQEIEKSLSSALRALNERSELCREMAARQSAAGNSVAARNWSVAEEQARERAQSLLIMTESHWSHPETTAR